ncbi:MAG: MFS transporter [Desertimonas sp.]
MALGSNYRKLFVATTISNLGDGVSVIAYPWLASAVTRNPILIAMVAAAGRLPWLVFTLPAGIITDRNDRRRLMIGANASRAVLTAFVAIAVLLGGDGLPGPDALDTVTGTRVGLYLAVLVATVCLGVAEVLYDNSAQTFLPAIVEPDDLERANGRMYSAELVTNQFAGPPLGSLLLAVGFAVPFFLDAATFAVSAALVFAIGGAALTHVGASPGGAPVGATTWRQDLREGFAWLWRHDLFRPMAIILGCMNGLGQVMFASFVLFGQEVLGTTPTQFALMSTGGAVGGIIGGWAASGISRRLGSGPSLWFTLGGSAVVAVAIGLSGNWLAVWVCLAIEMFVGVMWNVITVSLRQAVIPARLLGRVNSVYRFFAWGMIPLGALFGGIVVAVADAVTTREMALRMPYFVSAGAFIVLLAVAVPRLTTAKLDAARAGGVDRQM